MAAAVFYLCNGEKRPCGTSPGCYKNGGECRHTLSYENSKTHTIMTDQSKSRFKKMVDPKMGIISYWEKEVLEK